MTSLSLYASVEANISRSREYAHGLARKGLQGGFQFSLDRRLVRIGGENHIAAGDIGADVLETAALAHGAQLGHGELARASDIHRPQQGNVTRHGV